MISLLLTCRKDSKFLAKFILNFLVHTKDFNNVELLILIPPDDVWNKELLEYFKDKVKVFDDNTKFGRGGSNIFYDMLYSHAKGDWLWYLCDDHLLLDGYDEYITNYIRDNFLQPDRPTVIAPFVDNSGRITHILSRKYVELVKFAPQGNVDSCINDTLEYLEGIVGKEKHDEVLFLPPHPVLHDFSLDADLFKAPYFDKEYEKALFKSEPIREKLKANARKLAENL